MLCIKMVVMAAVPTAVNNTLSIEDIFSTVEFREVDDNPHIIFKREEKTVIKQAPYSTISKTFIPKEDMLPLEYGCAYNTHMVHVTLYQSEVPYVSINKPYDEDNEKDIVFVFNIKDLRKEYFLNIYRIFYMRLATEVVDYMISDFLDEDLIPFDFECEYKGEFPKSISTSQLKMLYECGFVKMGIHQLYVGYLDILSDEAFDHPYPSSQNRLQQIFRTKEDMNAFVQKKLDQLFF